MTETVRRSWQRGLDGQTLRSKYLEFFRKRGHAVIPSASLVPENDPSVLYTTAGMHPLVPYLLGQPHPAGTRLANVQKCVRTSDVESVGDATHLTFFEMLGNWSLGDYYKEESISWSFEFLTTPEGLEIPPDIIWVSVFAGDDQVPRDDESARSWARLGIPEQRIVRLSAEHNWWAVGDEGPCGPDTEIFIDKTGMPCRESGDRCLPGLCSCGRFVEIWNNVFMSFNRQGGTLSRLPKRNVDTGMGLERVVAVMNGAASVYETPLFQRIIDHLISGSTLTRQQIYADPSRVKMLRILADHIRAAVFMIGDERSVLPSNTGQGYILRRLIRRAVRACQQLDIGPAHWVKTAEPVIETYGDHYSELSKNRQLIARELDLERGRFEKTLAKGTLLLEREIDSLKREGRQMIPGNVAFRLYDTFGFPIEFTQEIAAEDGLSVDLVDYARAFEEHREKSRTEAAKSGLADLSDESVRYHTATHLLHAALRKVLGDHVEQKGSNITKERLRFDFSHPSKMTDTEISRTADLVQQWIDRGIEVTREVMTVEQARERGAIGLFSDSYGENVSVYNIGDVSMEFCGGPHVENTAAIGKFKIMKEQSSSAGVRRIRATIER